MYTPKRKKWGRFSYSRYASSIFTGTTISRGVYFKYKRHTISLKWEEFQPKGKPVTVMVNYPAES